MSERGNLRVIEGGQSGSAASAAGGGGDTSDPRSLDERLADIQADVVHLEETLRECLPRPLAIHAAMLGQQMLDDARSFHALVRVATSATPSGA